MEDRTTTATPFLARSVARFDPDRLVGRSPGFRAALETARAAMARPAAPVLLTGEAGTGRRTFGRTIHYAGPRRAAPFVVLDCAADPPDLLEAELLGVEKGGRPDAHFSRPGLVEAANGGTIYLATADRLPDGLRAALLRLVRDGVARRIGGSAEIAVDVRIMAALERPEDDRLELPGAIRLHLPPLRERPDDVVPLAERFLAELAPGTDATVTEELREALLACDWPGNARQLRHAVERALVLGGGSPRVEELLPPATAANGR